MTEDRINKETKMECCFIFPDSGTSCRRKAVVWCGTSSYDEVHFCVAHAHGLSMDGPETVQLLADCDDSIKHDEDDELAQLFTALVRFDFTIEQEGTVWTTQIKTDQYAWATGKYITCRGDNPYTPMFAALMEAWNQELTWDLHVKPFLPAAGVTA